MADPAVPSDVALMLLQAAEQDLAACDALAQAAGIGDAMVGFTPSNASRRR